MALRVLLADESTTIKKVMQLSLQDFAVEVKSVGNGLDVLTVTKSFKPDIIFVDILLPKRNGYEVCLELKSDPTTLTIPVVLMWSGFMELDETKASDSRADRRLEKPFDAETLRKIVKSLVTKTSSHAVSDFLQFPRMPDFADTPAQIPSREDIANSQVKFELPESSQTRPAEQASSMGAKPVALKSPAIPNSTAAASPQAVDEKWLREPEVESFEAFSLKSSPLANNDESFQALNLSSQGSSPSFEPMTAMGPESENDIDELGLPRLREEGSFTEISFGEEELNQQSAYEPSFRNQRDRQSEENSALSNDPNSEIISNSARSHSGSAFADLNALVLSKISESDIQKTIEIQVQRVVEDVCWKLLPDLLERVVREEINKLMKSVDDEFKIK